MHWSRSSGRKSANHRVIVVTDLEQSKAFYEQLGFTTSRHFDVHERYPGEEGAHHYRAIILREATQDSPVIWLMEPTSQDGPLRRFLSEVSAMMASLDSFTCTTP